jgi:hypothetical protein
MSSIFSSNYFVPQIDQMALKPWALTFAAILGKSWYRQLPTLN